MKTAAAHRAPHAHAPAGRAAHTEVLPVAIVGARPGARRARLGARRVPVGVVVVPHSANGRSVTRAEMQQALAGLRLLPAEDLAMIAQAGIQIHLYPTSGLEDNLLGATTIVQDSEGGKWRPTMIRVAARAGLTGRQSLPEIVQHEFGHAVSVIRYQDRSEDAAEAYAKRY